MTKMIYTVVSRPKTDRQGYTFVGWDNVPLGGYLLTSRTPHGEDSSYTAYLYKECARTYLGDDFTTRAQAAFAIWRDYNLDARLEKAVLKQNAVQRAEDMRMEREALRLYRLSTEGQAEHKAKLAEEARLRRMAWTPEQKENDRLKRKKKRVMKKFLDS